jgi:hypothetical protein
LFLRWVAVEGKSPYWAPASRPREPWSLPLGVEFEIEFGALTSEERDEFLALQDQRIAHGDERLEAIGAQTVLSGGPCGMTLPALSNSS